MEISVTKDAVKFGTSGDIGSANILCRQNNSVDKVGRRAGGRSVQGGALSARPGWAGASLF